MRMARKKRKGFVGIDPGATGSITTLDQDKKVLRVYRLASMKVLDIYQTLKRDSLTLDLEVLIEFIHPSPPSGKRYAKHSTAKAYASFRELTAIVICAGLVIENKAAISWQRHYGLRKPKGIKQHQWKRVLQEKAQQVFNDPKIVQEVSDSMLIANYLREKRTRRFNA